MVNRMTEIDEKIFLAFDFLRSISGKSENKIDRGKSITTSLIEKSSRIARNENKARPITRCTFHPGMKIIAPGGFEFGRGLPFRRHEVSSSSSEL